MYIIQKNLVYERTIVGNRLYISKNGYKFDVAFDFAIDNCNLLEYFKDSLSDILKEKPNILKSTVILYVREGKLLSDEEKNLKVLEISSKKLANNALLKVKEVYSKYIENLEYVRDEFQEKFQSGILNKLRREGISTGEDGYFGDDGKYSYCCRFIGGDGAWSGDEEDICDAYILDSAVVKVINSIVEEFNKKYGVSIGWNTGEKAWTYFKLY